MALYRAVRDEQDEREESPEVILARMEATIKRSGAIITEMETLNSQAGTIREKIDTLQEEIDHE